MIAKRKNDDRTRTVGAIVLIALGALFLMANLGWLSGVANWFWAVAFALGGTAFLLYALAERTHWWALIPGFGLVGLAAAVIGGPAGGGMFLALLGGGFAAVYALERTRWWAIIPAGTLLTLGLIAWMSEVFPAADTGSVFFLGLAATFGSLYLLPVERGRQQWAIYPALATLGLALVILASGAVTGVVIPVLLIAAGAYLLWRRETPHGRDENLPRSETGHGTHEA